MQARDIASGLDVAKSTAAISISATTTGTGVDLRGASGAAVIISAGVITGAFVCVPSLEESDDNSSYTAVAAADLEGVFPTLLVAGSTYLVGYKGTKRYIRSVLTKSSGTSMLVSSVILRGKLDNEPADHDYTS